MRSATAAAAAAVAFGAHRECPTLRTSPVCTSRGCGWTRRRREKETARGRSRGFRKTRNRRAYAYAFNTVDTLRSTKAEEHIYMYTYYCISIYKWTYIMRKSTSKGNARAKAHRQTPRREQITKKNLGHANPTCKHKRIEHTEDKQLHRGSSSRTSRCCWPVDQLYRHSNGPCVTPFPTQPTSMGNLRKERRLHETRKAPTGLAIVACRHRNPQARMYANLPRTRMNAVFPLPTCPMRWQVRKPPWEPPATTQRVES